MDQLNRREILTVAAVAAAAAACACTMASPTELLAADAPASAPSTLDAGPKSDYSKDGITDKFLAKGKGELAVVREKGKIFAFTSICTHKGCPVKAAGSDIPSDDTTPAFNCPCHHAAYSVEGKVLKGPATKSLKHYAISLDDKQHIIVDKSKSFDDSQWDDPASFIKADA